MAETVAYLVDNILPRVPVRQWVLSFPIPLRSLFAVHPELLRPVLRILHRAIHTHLIKQTGVKRDVAASGAITADPALWQRGQSQYASTRAGARRRLYQSVAQDSALRFTEATAPAQPQLQTLLHKIIKRIMTVLTRLDHLIEEDGIVATRSRAADGFVRDGLRIGGY